MSDDVNATDDSELEIEPRPAEEIARRAIIVNAVCQRVFLEVSATENDADEANEERFDLASWLQAEGLWSHATTYEQRLFAADVAQLGASEVDNASWLSESLIVLAWSLNLIDAIGAYSEAGDPRAGFVALPVPWDKTRSSIQQATIRPLTVLARERERAELWHWRAAVAIELDQTPKSRRPELLAVVAEVASEAHTASLLSRPRDGDFPVGDDPYRDLEREALDEVTSVAAERYRTLNWICGFGATWDDVPTDI